MRHSLLGSIICICVLCTSFVAVAGTNGYFQKTQKDSIPSRLILKTRVTIKDLSDGYTMDSVLVTVGSKKGYTNKSGYVEFDSILKESLITANKNGYLVSSKKVKPDLTIRLAKRESSSTANYHNGLYGRPPEHFSGASTVVSGMELRKVNPLNFIEALKFFAPSVVASRDNNYGDNPN